MSLAWVLPQIALVDGGVLRVDWNKLARLRQRHKQVAADNEGLLVSKCKTPVRCQGRMACFEPGSAHDGHEHAVDIIAACELAHGPCANAELRASGSSCSTASVPWVVSATATAGTENSRASATSSAVLELTESAVTCRRSAC